MGRAQVTISQANSPADIEATRTLFREYGASLGFSLCFQSFDAELASLPGDYAPPSGALLLARIESEREPIGCVAMHLWAEKKPHGNAQAICEMKRLYVRPDFRATGAGHALIAAILEAARAAGYRKMRLDTVSGVMDRAIAIYRRLGFREIAAYRANPQPGVLYMELDLANEPAATSERRAATFTSANE